MIELAPINISPLPASTTLTYISRCHWRSTPEESSLPIRLCSKLPASVEAPGMQCTQWPSTQVLTSHQISSDTCLILIKCLGKTQPHEWFPTKFSQHLRRWEASQRITPVHELAYYPDSPRGFPVTFVSTPEGGFLLVTKILQHLKLLQHPVKYTLSKIWISAFKRRDGASFKCVSFLLICLSPSGCSLFLLFCIL